MSTAAEQEAERRYPATARMRFAFESGAAFEREQNRELLEAAREYREAKSAFFSSPMSNDPEYVAADAWMLEQKMHASERKLLDAAAALDEEGGE